MSRHRKNFGKLFIVVRITTQKLYWYIIQPCVENKKTLKNRPATKFLPIFNGRIFATTKQSNWRMTNFCFIIQNAFQFLCSKFNFVIYTFWEKWVVKNRILHMMQTIRFSRNLGWELLDHNRITKFSWVKDWKKMIISSMDRKMNYDRI